MPKRLKTGGFERIIAPVNLWHAWLDFRKGKRQQPATVRFEGTHPRRLMRLAHQWRTGSYRPGRYRTLWLREPKRRLIAAAPVRDRVVHHAVHRVLAPALDRRLIDTTFACLPGRGSHRAILCLRRAMGRHRFWLLLDIRAYFPSIGPARVLAQMRRQVEGSSVIVFSSRPSPIAPPRSMPIRGCVKRYG